MVQTNNLSGIYPHNYSRPQTPTLQKRRVLRRAQKPRHRAMRPAFLLLICLFLLSSGVAVARRTGSTPSSSLPKQVSITVAEGDTLWKLAHRYGNPNRYILERVDELATANGIAADTLLYPGQEIMIPITGADDLARIQARLKTR